MLGNIKATVGCSWQEGCDNHLNIYLRFSCDFVCAFKTLVTKTGSGPDSWYYVLATLFLHYLPDIAS